MDVALSAAKWVVGKALSTVTDGVLEAWDSSNNLGLNIKDLSMELLLVKSALEVASNKQLSGPAMEQLLQKLRDSAHTAEDLLDELDYFRIHDQLHGKHDAADEDGRTGMHNLILNTRHTAKAVGKQLASLPGYWCGANAGDPRQDDASQHVNCCAWKRDRHMLRDRQDDASQHVNMSTCSSSSPNATWADEEVSCCTPKLGKLLPCSSSPHVHGDDDDSGKSTFCRVRKSKAPHRMLGFNRVDVSQRMQLIVKELQPLRTEVLTILHGCGAKALPNIAQSRPATRAQSIEPKLYGRDRIMDSIIHDITKSKYCDEGLAVLPVVGPGGIGKTTLIQHINQNQEVQNHFPVRIWVCVLLNFNLNKLLEEIEKSIPRVQDEIGGTTEEMIEQRLKSKRFLLVLDDIWGFSNEDDWKSLLLPLRRSQEKGNMILVTTRFPSIAQKVKTMDPSIKTFPSIELEGLESEEFRKLFLAFVFGNEQCPTDHLFLLKIGDKIMEKLKGSPLAAKTVGRLLQKNLSLPHWRGVLRNKEWETQTDSNGIMPALKLSYDYLPFHLQQCFCYSALFPEDYQFKSHQLISLWIGLGILIPSAQIEPCQDVGLSYLKELVIQGFFREEETKDGPCYVMHDLLHDLALTVASKDCLISVHLSDVGLVQVQPCTRHLSIIIEYMSIEKFKTELEKLKTRLQVEHLQTLMLFGDIDETEAKIFGDLFREANALRILLVPNMVCPLESMLQHFPRLVHLRFLCLGTTYRVQMLLPLTISTFYHLRVLDLQFRIFGDLDLPKDITNLEKLSYFYTRRGELHSGICNVGKLKLLEQLKVFRVKKESEGFEPKQLEHLNKLTELGIFDLQKIKKKEADEAKLIDKHYLKMLTLDWDSKRCDFQPDADAAVLESLQPHEDLQVLSIRWHGGPSCPTWLGDNLAVDALQSLNIVGVSWNDFPSLGKMWELRRLVLKCIATMKEFVTEPSFCSLIRLELVGLDSLEKWLPGRAQMFPCLQVLIIKHCHKLLEVPFSNQDVYPPGKSWNIELFPKLQELEILACAEFLSVIPIPWTETLCTVKISLVKLLDDFTYSKSPNGMDLKIIGNPDLQSLDQVVAFHKETGLEKLILLNCPPLELKHLLMLTSLKKLCAYNSDSLVGPLEGQGNVGWQLPVESIIARNLCGLTGRQLTELLPHLPRLSKLEVHGSKKITELVVGVDLQGTTLAASEEITWEQENEEDGALLFPAHLCDTLQELTIWDCPELVVGDPPTFLTSRMAFNKNTGGGERELQTLRCLQGLTISSKAMLRSPSWVSSPPRHLAMSTEQVLWHFNLTPSYITSLPQLESGCCGEDLKLITARDQDSELIIYGSLRSFPVFYLKWDPETSEVLQDGGEEQQMQLVSPPTVSTKLALETDDDIRFLSPPICFHLSTALTRLQFHEIREIEQFNEEQEEAFQLLTGLEELVFSFLTKLRHLPASLHRLCHLRRLIVRWCPSIESLPEDGLPSSLLMLHVGNCQKLKEQCRGLAGTIPNLIVDVEEHTNLFYDSD